MKIVFLGTPDFAVLPLEAIVKSNHEVLAVVTQPDRPVGRKAIITPCQVKQYAKSVSLKVLSYEKISKEGIEDLKALNPDIMVTCAFGQILSSEVLSIAKHGVINIHASLLPKYRGASPIQHSILNGDTQTGVTIMKTDVGVDTGDIILQRKLDILPEETAGELFDRLSVLGANAIIQALDLIESGKETYIKQNDNLASHVKMIKKADGLIDFNKSAVDICNIVRAFNPWPIAYTYYQGKTLKVYKCRVENLSGEAGEVIPSIDGVTIATGSGAITLLEVQLEGSKKMPIKDFLLGHKIEVGYKF